MPLSQHQAEPPSLRTFDRQDPKTHHTLQGIPYYDSVLQCVTLKPFVGKKVRSNDNLVTE